MKKLLTLGTALLLPAFMAGCIATGTFVFVFDIEGNQSSPVSILAQMVDLTENDEYNDHKDKIKSIDAVAVVGEITNNLPAETVGQIWISDELYVTPDEVRQNATLVFETPSIPGNSTIFIDWSDGLSRIQHFDELKAQVESGNFIVYGISTGAFDLFFDLNLIVTFTAGV